MSSIPATSSLQIERTDQPIAQVDAETVVVFAHANGPLRGPTAAANEATGGLITRLIEASEISGKPHEIVPLLGPTGIAARQLIVAGLGDAERLNSGVLYRSSAAAARHAAAKARNKVAVYLPEGLSNKQAESAIAGLIVGCQGQDLYRAEKKRHSFDQLLISGASEQAIASGRVLGEHVNLTRRLVNEPPDVIYPASFAEWAQRVASEAGLSAEVWDEQRLKAERCGALLGVAKGSSQPPRLVILRYSGGRAGDKPLALVGKGVTFDSGGLSLKPSDSMLTMKCDMAGAATVLGAMGAIAKLKLPVNVVGLVGLVENMTGPAAMKLGDVLTARNGRTIEIHNTDAEGRLVLADVLSVAVDLGVSRIVDLATLTGACVVALGNDVAGLMTNDQQWCDRLKAAADVVGEPVWQLPMFPEIYNELIKSEVADIKNVGEGRWGGAITAAKFLEQFVGETPWTHMDIAGPAFLEKPKPWSDGGASGAYVRTLVELVRNESA